MKVYLATKWEEADRMREVKRALKARGHTITYDWSQNGQFDAQQAINDFCGVEDADVVVVLAEKDLPYKGAYTEFGMALAWRKPVVILGEHFDKCIFVKLPGVQHVYTLDALFTALQNLSY